MTPIGSHRIRRLRRPGPTSATQLRARGLRWTPQRRTLIEVLSQTDGHVTGAELVERCRAVDPTTTPSTVYRTLDVLEELGLLSHSHGADGREEFHVRPVAAHGHLHCIGCGTTWEIGPDEAAIAGRDARAPARVRGRPDVTSRRTLGALRQATAPAALAG